jgi:hypothetical protein
VTIQSSAADLGNTGAQDEDDRKVSLTYRATAAKAEGPSG